MEAIRMIEPGKPLELRQIPIPSAGEEDVLERHVDDRNGDQRFDQRRKPKSRRPKVVSGRNERNGVRNRKRRDDWDQSSHPAEWDHQAQ